MIEKLNKAFTSFLIVLLYYYPHISIDDELKPYVYSFADQCGMKVGDFNTISLVDCVDKDDEGVVGVCLVSTYQSNIKIKRNHWNIISDTQRMALIGHEMIHCKYWIPDIYDDSQISDIMYFDIPNNDEFIKSNWNANIRKYCR